MKLARSQFFRPSLKLRLKVALLGFRARPEVEDSRNAGSGDGQTLSDFCRMCIQYQRILAGSLRWDAQLVVITGQSMIAGKVPDEKAERAIVSDDQR